MSGRGVHRRTPPARQLDLANAEIGRLQAALDAERGLRLLADDLMGHLVEEREFAREDARRAHDQSVLDRERLRQARELIADLRGQAARPHPTGAAERTQAIPQVQVVPLGSPHWQHVQDLADQVAIAQSGTGTRPFWARAAS